MWTIRKSKAKLPTQFQSTGKAVSQPDYAIPRFMARQLLMFMRLAHVACDDLKRMYELMPEDRRRVYEHLRNVQIGPNFADLMALISVSQKVGLFSREEANDLREGVVKNIDCTPPTLEPEA